MNKVSDSELLMLFHEKVEEAENMLNQKYEIIIKLILKKYVPIIKILNISFEDLIHLMLYTKQSIFINFQMLF